jgi:hypothetical protein
MFSEMVAELTESSLNSPAIIKSIVSQLAIIQPASMSKPNEKPGDDSSLNSAIQGNKFESRQRNKPLDLLLADGMYKQIDPGDRPVTSPVESDIYRELTLETVLDIVDRMQEKVAEPEMFSDERKLRIQRTVYDLIGDESDPLATSQAQNLYELVFELKNIQKQSKEDQQALIEMLEEALGLEAFASASELEKSAHLPAPEANAASVKLPDPEPIDVSVESSVVPGLRPAEEVQAADNSLRGDPFYLTGLDQLASVKQAGLQNDSSKRVQTLRNTFTEKSLFEEMSRLTLSIKAINSGLKADPQQSGTIESERANLEQWLSVLKAARNDVFRAREGQLLQRLTGETWPKDTSENRGQALKFLSPEEIARGNTLSTLYNDLELIAKMRPSSAAQSQSRLDLWQRLRDSVRAAVDAKERQSDLAVADLREYLQDEKDLSNSEFLDRFRLLREQMDYLRDTASPVDENLQQVHDECLALFFDPDSLSYILSQEFGSVTEPGQLTGALKIKEEFRAVAGVGGDATEEVVSEIIGDSLLSATGVLSNPVFGPALGEKFMEPYLNLSNWFTVQSTKGSATDQAKGDVILMNRATGDYFLLDFTERGNDERQVLLDFGHGVGKDVPHRRAFLVTAGKPEKSWKDQGVIARAQQIAKDGLSSLIVTERPFNIFSHGIPSLDGSIAASERISWLANFQEGLFRDANPRRTAWGAELKSSFSQLKWEKMIVKKLTDGFALERTVQQTLNHMAAEIEAAMKKGGIENGRQLLLQVNKQLLPLGYNVQIHNTHDVRYFFLTISKAGKETLKSPLKLKHLT